MQIELSRDRRVITVIQPVSNSELHTEDMNLRLKKWVKTHYNDIYRIIVKTIEEEDVDYEGEKLNLTQIRHLIFQSYYGVKVLAVDKDKKEVRFEINLIGN